MARWLSPAMAESVGYELDAEARPFSRRRVQGPKYKVRRRTKKRKRTTS